jgi:hypothetical protein
MHTRKLAVVAVACLLALLGCNIDYQIIANQPSQDGSLDENDASARTDGDGGGDGDGDGDGDEPTPPDPVICERGGHCSRLTVTGDDRLDLLFVVDNSGSMREEQAALRAQLPDMLRALTSGDIDADGTQDMPSARDLHVGVVSTDLGLSGITGIPLCTGLGSDGTMVDVRACSPESNHPRFLEYSAGGDRTPADLAVELSCVADLGTMGCGFEQQLENTLKALWPANDVDVWFLPDPAGFGATGQAGQLGANGDFIRNDPNAGLSTIAIVLITDEEDCSSGNMSHLRPDNGTLDPSDPLKQQGLNTRCFFESQLDRDPAMDGIQNNLYGPSRYVQALRALRPGAEERVVFAAIVGVPQDLVEESDLGAVDFSDPAEGRAFYDAILGDPRMQQTLDDRGTAEVADDNLVPSCDRGVDAKAYPPRRIVETVAGFGENGIVQSICQDDFSPALNVITRRIGASMAPGCLDQRLARSDGMVACDMIWELPLPGEAPASSPTRCDDRSFLSLRATRSDERQLCAVDQVAVEGGGPAPEVEGFYWDDVSDVGRLCGDRGRIQFTSDAQPPTGVSVYLDCD